VVLVRQENNSLSRFGVDKADTTRIARLRVRDATASTASGERCVVEIEQRREWLQGQSHDLKVSLTSHFRLPLLRMTGSWSIIGSDPNSPPPIVER
jgi:hypothetical protein